MAQADRSTAIAERMADGRIVCGEYARMAAERHLRDLSDGHLRGLQWRPAEAQRIIDSYPSNFTITDGPKAGDPFTLLDWMAFTSGSLFGWWRQTREGDWRWRFDEAWIDMAKGQGKTPWLASTSLLMLGGFGRKRAEVVITGPKDEQSLITLRDAGTIVQSTIPGEEDGVTLESQGKFLVRGVGDNIHTIEHIASRSVMKTSPGSAKKTSGFKPAAVGVDEVHELTDYNLIEMWAKALTKNAVGGLLLQLTNCPAFDQAVGTMLAERAHRMLRGEEQLDTLFAYVARVDVADRETVFDNEACWIKAMPALGVTYPIDNIRQEVEKARVSPAKAASLKRLYFGIPGGGADFWLDDPRLWDRALAPVDEGQMVNYRCWLSLDLADRHDLVALTATWAVPAPMDEDPEAVRLVQKTWYWTRGDGVAERAKIDGMAYEAWAADGFITIVPGPMISKDFVALQVQHLAETQLVEFLTFDPAKINEFIEAAGRVDLQVWRYQGKDKPAGKGLMMVTHSQGTQVRFIDHQLSMPGSVTAFEDRLRDGTITIDANPINTACAANAKMISDGQSNRAFDKKTSRGRIDGIITKAMGVGAAGFQVARKKSVYSERGIIRL
ncbi:terminase TerL endonuclease subunit [Sandarakinorhabdus sp.]|uniref:terminase TerL endonuclease subunit n=1 Tax=Sandarakinorhabdus sp. TaxID=1916663 RepID=UPI00286DA742|nr:terminase TerL endonuclease subunit [Sandarakinorhabdus sp.]